MTIRLIIDGAHKEQVRMAVIDGQKLDEYDQVITEKAPIKGNIYLGKITRVEPSLQAAFVDYGSNRHGFLSFAEIHPDYYKIPMADKQKLLEEEENLMDDDDDDMDEEQNHRKRHDDDDDRARRRHYSKLRAKYLIQEVIKKNQIVLVQVVKEERGLKGAALTTYISVAGRYCVLMPNTTRGGGVSRKVNDMKERRRLKTILNELQIPRGMGIILRTAGADRSENDIIRDFEYVSNLWDEIRELIMTSNAPALIHEESNLVKRAIRDYYRSHIDEILVEGEEAYNQARTTLKALIPAHIKKLSQYENPDKIPIFSYYGIEDQILDMTNNQIQLRGGGFLIINQTEALVSIDVNSGKSTKERHIEDTALKTNLEAAEEVARQIRLRDLAGLIVVDFIDMIDKNYNRRVEGRLKDCLKRDRARIQVGYISSFGLLEMSRQRLRQSMVESMGSRCHHCNGTGIIISLETIAMNLIREIQITAGMYGAGAVQVQANSELLAYLLSHKRNKMDEIAESFELELIFELLTQQTGDNFMVRHELDNGKQSRNNKIYKFHDDKPNRQRHQHDGDDGYEGEDGYDDHKSHQHDRNERGDRGDRRDNRNDNRGDNRNENRGDRNNNRHKNKNRYQDERHDNGYARAQHSHDEPIHEEDMGEDSQYSHNNKSRDNYGKDKRGPGQYRDGQPQQAVVDDGYEKPQHKRPANNKYAKNKIDEGEEYTQHETDIAVHEAEHHDAKLDTNQGEQPKKRGRKPATKTMGEDNTSQMMVMDNEPNNESNNESNNDLVEQANREVASSDNMADNIGEDKPKKRGRKPATKTMAGADNAPVAQATKTEQPVQEPVSAEVSANVYDSVDAIEVPKVRKQLKMKWQ